MSRLAFLSPLPPAPTGIADYAVEVLQLLAGRHRIEAFCDQDRVETERLPPGCAVRPAHEFLARHRERPYDLAVYQLGNAEAHAFVYDLLARVPGLLVLHDLVLHHARARTFLDAPEVRAWAAEPASGRRREAALPRLQAYREELAYSYPAQADRLADVQLGTVGDLLPYAYPLFRIPAEASRAVAAHNRFVTEAVAEEVPGLRTFRVPMPVEASTVPRDAVTALRERLGLAPGDVVVGSFGLLTREKRVETVARAVARASWIDSRIRLLLVGPVPDPAGLEQMLGRLGVRERAVVTGRVPFPELATHIEAADVVAHLRYPTARETSAALLRVLAQGRPAIISDLIHWDEIPDSAALRVDLTDEEGALTRALLRLAASPEARDRLSRSAAAFVQAEHSPARCLEAYEEAIETTRRLPDPPPRAWPGHWLRA